MNANDFEKYKQVFRLRQIESNSRVAQNTVMRKFGGGAGREVKTLHLLYVDPNWRPGATVRPVGWLGHVVDIWNSALKSVTLDKGLNIADAPRWELDANSVTVEVRGTTLKVSGSMVEVQQ